VLSPRAAGGAVMARGCRDSEFLHQMCDRNYTPSSKKSCSSLAVRSALATHASPRRGTTIKGLNNARGELTYLHFLKCSAPPFPLTSYGGKEAALVARLKAAEEDWRRSKRMRRKFENSPRHHPIAGV